MSDMERMSKYARKKARQMKALAAADRTLASIDLAMRTTERTAAPDAPKPAKPKTPPPEPRGQIADLGDRPASLARHLRDAADALRLAVGLAQTILAMSKPGIQQAEPRSIASSAGALGDKAAGLARRALFIPNAPQADGQGGAE